MIEIDHRMPRCTHKIAEWPEHVIAVIGQLGFVRVGAVLHVRLYSHGRWVDVTAADERRIR